MKEKDKKFEGRFEGEYMHKTMTGMEAYMCGNTICNKHNLNDTYKLNNEQRRNIGFYYKRFSANERPE
jgi:hypothetical protein